MLYLLTKADRHRLYSDDSYLVTLTAKLEVAPWMYYNQGYERMCSWDTTCAQCAKQVKDWIRVWSKTTTLYMAAGAKKGEAVLYCQKSNAPGKDKSKDKKAVGDDSFGRFFGYNEV